MDAAFGGQCAQTIQVEEAQLLGKSSSIRDMGGGVEAHQDVGEVRQGLDAAGVAGGDHGVEGCEVLSGLLVANEKEVLSPESHDTQSRFAAIVVWGDPDITDKASQGLPVLQSIPNGLAHLPFGGCRLRCSASQM